MEGRIAFVAVCAEYGGGRLVRTFHEAGYAYDGIWMIFGNRWHSDCSREMIDSLEWGSLITAIGTALLNEYAHRQINRPRTKSKEPSVSQVYTRT